MFLWKFIENISTLTVMYIQKYQCFFEHLYNISGKHILTMTAMVQRHWRWCSGPTLDPDFAVFHKIYHVTKRVTFVRIIVTNKTPRIHISVYFNIYYHVISILWTYPNDKHIRPVDWCVEVSCRRIVPVTMVKGDNWQHDGRPWRYEYIGWQNGSERNICRPGLAWKYIEFIESFN